MKKRILALFLTIIMVVSSFAGCSEAGTGGGNDVIEAKTYPMRIQFSSAKAPEEKEITLYFMNGGDVPYVAMSEYMPFVGSMYGDDEQGLPAVEYEFSNPVKDHTMIARKDNGSFMDINAAADTIEFLGMDYFIAMPDNSLLMGVISISENDRGGYSNLFEDYGASYERNGDALLLFDLSEYDIDLIEKDGECYVPLQTVNDLLVSQNYVYVIFNGIEVLASAYSAPLLDEMYNAPTGEMSEGFANYNYNELRFMLDTFYGLKPEHGISDFGDFFSSTGLLGDLAGTDPVAFDRAVRVLTTKYFDDKHSGMSKYSFYSGDIKAEKDNEDELISVLDSLGQSSDAMVWDSMRIKGARAEYYPDHPNLDPLGVETEDPWFYEEIGDTAIVTFDVFDLKRREYYKEADLGNPQDTVELISYAQSRITREDSPIKNVVVDLSCNGGGAADAAVFVMAWLKANGDAVVALKNTLTGAQSIGHYGADINLDGTVDFDDALPVEINRYILTSDLSFSCGNLVPAALKGEPNITLIGKRSGGGSCVVRPCSTASGTIFTISGPVQISCVRNGSLYNADQGVEPDFVISKLENYYDREKLVEFIHQLP